MVVCLFPVLIYGAGFMFYSFGPGLGFVFVFLWFAWFYLLFNFIGLLVLVILELDVILYSYILMTCMHTLPGTLIKEAVH